MDQTPNYKNKSTQRRSITRQRQLVLSVLLSASMTFSGITIAKKAVDAIQDQIIYNKSTEQHYDIVLDNIHRTSDKENYFIDTFDVAEDIKELEVADEYDLYHHLIGVAKHIDWNRNKNFQDILYCLNLDEAAKVDSNYPTEAEFMKFLESNKLLNEDGTIDFDAWEKIDKKIINLEHDLEKVGMKR